MKERDLEYRGINDAIESYMMFVVSGDGSICAIWNRTGNDCSILVLTSLLPEQIDMR